MGLFTIRKKKKIGVSLGGSMSHKGAVDKIRKMRKNPSMKHSRLKLQKSKGGFTNILKVRKSK